MKKKLFIVFLLTGVFFSCESKSEKQIIVKNKTLSNNEKNIESLNETTNGFTDSIKVVNCKEFQLLFTQFNKEINLWYSPKLIVNNDTLLISGISNENGSELSINKSPNGNLFIMDNIIKGYVENDNGEKILHENFTCLIVNVKEAKVELSLQSECDGSWNSQNEWISNGNIVFAK